MAKATAWVIGRTIWPLMPPGASSGKQARRTIILFLDNVADDFDLLTTNTTRDPVRVSFNNGNGTDSGDPRPGRRHGSY